MQFWGPEVTLVGPVLGRCHSLNLPSPALEMGETLTHPQREEDPSIGAEGPSWSPYSFPEASTPRRAQDPQAHGLFLCKGLSANQNPGKKRHLG